MDRNQEARRGTMAATANGLSRRRQRSSSLRDSPDEDGAVELQETARFRDRTSKKDRERDRDRDRDRDRSSRSKRRRGERFLHGSNREEGNDESSEESVDDEDEEEDEDAALMALRLQQINPSASAVSTSSSVPDHNHLRKSFPAKASRPAGPCKVAEEIIGVSVPRKARSAFAKRPQECWISGGSNGAEPIQRQASTSPARPSTAAAVPAAPISPPSSSNASVRKKMKPIGSKHRPPKVSKTSSIQETEIEFEIAEVLYGMTRQFQSPPKQEGASVPQKLNSRDANGSSNDGKSRGSSPISILPPTELPPSSSLQQNSNATPVAPKRKRPRPPKLEEERPANIPFPNASVSYATKIDAAEQEKMESSSSKSEKKMPSAVENGCGSEELGSSQIPSIPSELPQDSVKPKSDPDSEPPKAESDGLDAIGAKEEIASPVNGSPCAEIDADHDDAIARKPESEASAVDPPREEKFEIDLMAFPSGKSSPERDDNMADAVTIQKPLGSENETMVKKETVKAEEEKAVVNVEEAGEVGSRVKKTETTEEQDFQKQMVMERIFDLQVDPEKLDKDGDKLQVPKQATKATKIESKAEKAAQSPSLPLPMTIAGWPGALPPIGYMGQIPPPLPAVSVDGGTGSAAAMQPANFLPRPQRPKRCATHYYIAQCIDYQRQIARLPPFWPGGAAGFAPQCGTKPCNLNALPASESAILGNPLQGSFAGRNLSSLQDKGSGDHALNDKNAAVMFMDTSQRKQQIVLQQAPQPAPANNMLAPAFIFPVNQQQPTPVTPPGAVKSATSVSNAASSASATNSILGSAASSGSASGTGTASTMTFNYANLPTNDAQYLALLQNGYHQFPMPHVGGPHLYRANHHPAVPMPFFNPPFYSPQMLHPSQLQQQHLQSQPPVVHLGNQNTGAASGSSSTQKHQQQQQPQGCVGNGGIGNSTGFPTLKQCQQQQQNYLPPQHTRQLESEMGNADNRCSNDSRVSHSQKSIYNHNFMMPVHSQNFTIMSPSALGSGNQGEKQQQQQQQSLKGGMELNQSQAFAMSFAAFNGAAASPGLDFSSMAQNHAIFQSLPEPARHGYQMATSAAASSRAAQQKNHQTIEERKPVNDSINSNASGEEERKMKMTGKAPPTISHTLTFSRPDNDPSISSILGNTVVDSSSKNLSAIPASGNGSRASSRSGVVPPATAIGTTALTGTPNSQYNPQHLIQLQKHQIQMQQQMQQQQQLVAHAKSASSNANTNLYSDRLPSAMGKFPNSVSIFPQALAQGSGPGQVPQWKTSTKAGATPIPSSEASTPSAKSLPQQQGRNQLGVPASGHTQISFGMNTKSSSCMQQFTSNNPSPSSAGGVAGSPPTSISKSAGGSPRTTTDGKACTNTISSSSQPGKNTPSSSSRKSSPVSSRHVPSILGNSHVSSAQSSAIKPQQQQQLPKQQFQQAGQPTLQQAQAIFPNFYMQAQSPQSTSTSNTSGSYQKRQSEQQQHNSLAVSSTGMMSLCSPSVPFSSVSSSEPAKAVTAAAVAAAAAAAASNMKGLPSPSHGYLHPTQFAPQSAGNPHLLMSAAIPYIHSVPAVPMKSGEQKPTAGNDILHPSWQPEKR